MKILISDIDSSMFSMQNADTVNAINKFINKGNLFIIATDKAINYVADTLALSDLISEYYICNDGAVIFDKFFNVLFRRDLKQSVVRPIVEMLEDDDNILETFVDTSHGFVKDTSKPANGVVARPYDRIKAEMLLNSIVLKYPDVHGYVNDNWLNITDVTVSKLAAIEFLNHNYRLDTSDVYVLGKDITDLDLMEKFNGYNLKDCSEDIKKYSKGEVENLKELIDLLIKEEERKDFDTIYE